MKSILVFAVLALALSFCGIVNRFTGGNSSFNLPTNSTTTTAGNSSSGGGATNVTYETPPSAAAQQAVIDGGKEVSWDAQGLKWKMPQNWKKMSEDKNTFHWMSPDVASLIANISVLGNDFPTDISLKATYDSQVTQMKNGELETVRYLEIDGVKGVEFVQTDDGRDNPRRHHWIAYRKYAGQTQMLNFILATKGGNFDKHRDDFAAVLYSTKIVK